LEDLDIDGEILKWIFKKWEGIDWVYLGQNKERWWPFTQPPVSIKYGQFLD
jgi:hypothetical protein